MTIKEQLDRIANRHEERPGDFDRLGEALEIAVKALEEYATALSDAIGPQADTKAHRALRRINEALK